MYFLLKIGIFQCHVSELRDVSFRVYYKIWRPLDGGIQSYKPLNDNEAGSGDYYRLYTSPTLNEWIPAMMIWKMHLRLQILLFFGIYSFHFRGKYHVFSDLPMGISAHIAESPGMYIPKMKNCLRENLLPINGCKIAIPNITQQNSTAAISSPLVERASSWLMALVHRTAGAKGFIQWGKKLMFTAVVFGVRGVGFCGVCSKTYDMMYVKVGLDQFSCIMMYTKCIKMFCVNAKIHFDHEKISHIYIL